jgi:hypothetical protein
MIWHEARADLLAAAEQAGGLTPVMGNARAWP